MGEGALMLSTRYCPRTCQLGAITLAVSLGILVLSTLVTFSVSRAILMEQKITNNEGRARQAFEAAEAGLIEAMSYLRNDPDVNLDNVVDTNVLDSNNDGTADSTTRAVGNSSVTVTVTDMSGNLTEFRIVSQGFSDDRSSTRTIEQIMVTINPLPNAPQNPVVTRGSIIISGSATVHNPEGHSTIWSGNDIDLGSNNSTSTEVPDAADPDYPGCMDIPMTCDLVQASSRLLAGVDIIENDSSLGSLTADEFFRNFFGISPSTYRASMVTIDTTPAMADAEVDLATNEVIWIDGDHEFGSVTVGCTTSVSGNNVCPANNTKPSIIIVDGDASFQGTPQFYGLLFVTGSLTMSGNTTVYGAVVAAGNATSDTGGSLDVWFSSSVLGATSRAGASAGSAGTWKDF
jgi:Tfp pilus assembly protein PilX